MRGSMWLARMVASVAVLALVGAACGNDEGNGSSSGNDGNLEGSLNISGSSTVEPITSLVAEKFQSENPGVTVAVDGPGTSDGFELFCNGGTDINDASREIDQSEIDACAANGITPIELEVGLDALSVIANPANPLSCAEFGDLYALFGPESEGIDTWDAANSLAQEVGASADLPNLGLTIVAPGEESGTYGSFIDLAIGDIAEERGQADDALRGDYQAAPDDNVIIENAAGNEGGLGFVGFAFARNAGDSVKSLEVDGGDGCVAPSSETVVDGSYPLSRSLYIYVSKEAIQTNPALKPFVDRYMSDDGLASVEEVQYISLPDERIEASRSAWESESA